MSGIVLRKRPITNCSAIANHPLLAGIAQIADSSSRNAVSISSARTTKRFPSRCASAIQIVRPSASIAETQPQLQPALLRFSAALLIKTHEQKGEPRNREQSH